MMSPDTPGPSPNRTFLICPNWSRWSATRSSRLIPLGIGLIDMVKCEFELFEEFNILRKIYSGGMK